MTRIAENPARMAPLNPAGPGFEAALRARLPEAAFRPLSSAYLEEPRAILHGVGGLLVAPASREEVAEVIRLCARERVGVVPFGGGTGLVGGQVMAEGPDPVILSLERMNRIRAVHRQENVLVAEAGAILADVQKAADDAERLFPLALASEGSCRIGGNLATNAGGVNVLRYGNARDLCLGLEAVLPDGQIWHGLRRLRKDNTGYDLKDLLVGAEGTLGVITAASLRLFARPASYGTALIVVPGPAEALDLLALAGEVAGPVLSAFELISGTGLRFLAETGLPARAPIEGQPDWSVLIELGCGADQDGQALLEKLFMVAHERGLAPDGVVAQSVAQRRALWDMREQIPAANKRIGAISSHDISLPLSAIPGFIHEADALVARLGGFRVNCFGHLGDGNLHYNVFAPEGQGREAHAARRGEIAGAIHDLVHAHDGSFSAEHGVGRLKVGELARFGDPARLAAMRAIKSALDPHGIMNPGVIFASAGAG